MPKGLWVSAQYGRNIGSPGQTIPRIGKCRPGYDRTKENRPRESLFQERNLLSDEIASALKKQLHKRA